MPPIYFRLDLIQRFFSLRATICRAILIVVLILGPQTTSTHAAQVKVARILTGVPMLLLCLGLSKLIVG